LHKALDIAKSGNIIVADMGQLTEAGSWGEIASFQAKIKGIVGLVTNGSVRDSLEINKLEFSIFCKAVSIKGIVKESIGYINHYISCGDVVVNSGDIILGDEDGVVVIPLQEAEEILIKSREIIEKEEKLIKRIQAGESLFEMSGYQEVLKRKGCVEEE